MINNRELNIILTTDCPRELIKELCTMLYNTGLVVNYTWLMMSGDCSLGGGFTGGLIGLCCHFFLENYVNCNAALHDIIERSLYQIK